MPRRGGPPWWPEGEPWPPREGYRGQYHRRFLRRIVVLIGVLLLLFAIAGWVFHNGPWENGPWEGDGGPQRDGPPYPWVPPVFILTVIAIAATIIVRRLRRTIAPIGQMMIATRRVAEGDYAARIDGTRAGDLGDFVTSFNTMVERLESSNDQRKRLLADVAHELRTPLAVIQGTLEGMIDGVYGRGDDEVTPLLDQTKVIARLLDDLQTVSNADAGALRLDRVDVNLRDLLTDVIDRLRPIAQRGDTALVAEVEPELELTLDPVRMRQVLDNLVVNAIRYTPGGEVRLTAVGSASGVTITVEDNGRGMPAEDADRMFARFVKSADSGGSGLGLAIARSLVVAHGGTISAVSAPGAGMTVTITLAATTGKSAREGS